MMLDSLGLVQHSCGQCMQLVKTQRLYAGMTRAQTTLLGVLLRVGHDVESL